MRVTHKKSKNPSISAGVVAERDRTLERSAHTPRHESIHAFSGKPAPKPNLNANLLG